MDVTAERADIDRKVSGKTVCTIFADAVRNWPDRTALRWKRDGEWHQLTWREYGDHVAAATLALRDLGFGPGQFGLIMARNVPERVIRWDDLLARGRELHEAEPQMFERSWRAVGPEDTVSLIYTSGTTGPPKGVVYSHNNIIWTLESIDRMQKFQGDTVISYLPLAHVAERFSSEWRAPYDCFEVWMCPDPNILPQYLLEARPTLFLGVPRVWEKLMAGLQAGVAAEPDESKRKMVQGAISAAITARRLRQDGKAVPPELVSGIEQAQPLFGLLRAKIGLDRCATAFTSTAPCRPEVHDFWAALGLPLYEVWGMSELTGPATAVPRDGHQTPSIGVPLPGVEVKLGEDGEILVRGGNVMVGYYREPAKTADMVDADGWVHSGDIGTLGPDGHFRIVDRKKELIITSAGKNISPANLEALAKSSPIIGQAVAVGDGRKFISALVVNPVVVDEVRRALQQANTHLSRVEQFKRFTILPADWSPESEELTPTMKLKRRVINSKYSSQIESMYSDQPGGHDVDGERAEAAG